MLEVRIHGRGGQGVVTAAEVLSVAAFLDGRHAQALPSFGSERMGAPVVAFCRIDDRPIRRHDPVTSVDALVVQDPTLLHEVALFTGLADEGWVLVNTSRTLERLGLDELARRHPPGRVVTLPATEIAQRVIGRPVPNTVLLGGLAALSGAATIPTVVAAIRRRFPGPLGEANARAAEEAAALVSGAGEAIRGA